MTEALFLNSPYSTQLNLSCVYEIYENANPALKKKDALIH